MTAHVIPMKMKTKKMQSFACDLCRCRFANKQNLNMHHTLLHTVQSDFNYDFQHKDFLNRTLMRPNISPPRGHTQPENSLVAIQPFEEITLPNQNHVFAPEALSDNPISSETFKPEASPTFEFIACAEIKELDPLADLPDVFSQSAAAQVALLHPGVAGDLIKTETQSQDVKPFLLPNPAVSIETEPVSDVIFKTEIKTEPITEEESSHLHTLPVPVVSNTALASSTNPTAAQSHAPCIIKSDIQQDDDCEVKMEVEEHLQEMPSEADVPQHAAAPSDMGSTEVNAEEGISHILKSSAPTGLTNSRGFRLLRVTSSNSAIPVASFRLPQFAGGSGPAPMLLIMHSDPQGGGAPRLEICTPTTLPSQPRVRIIPQPPENPALQTEAPLPSEQSNKRDHTYSKSPLTYSKSPLTCSKSPPLSVPPILPDKVTTAPPNPQISNDVSTVQCLEDVNITTNQEVESLSIEKIQSENSEQPSNQTTKIYCFDCKFCNKTFQTKLLLASHVKKNHTNDNTGASLLVVCRADNYVEWTLRKHHESKHPKIKYTSKTLEPCEKVYTSSSDLKNHIQEHSSQMRCSHCRFDAIPSDAKPEQLCVILWETERVYDTIRKLVDTHPVGGMYGCSFCNRLCLMKSELQDHILSNHLLEQFKCLRCSYTYHFPDEMVQHWRSNHSTILLSVIDCDPLPRWDSRYFDNPIQCKLCQEKFLLMSLFSLHNKTKHEDISQFQCSKCQLQFCLKSDLELHWQDEHCSMISLLKFKIINGKSYEICQSCFKVFKSESQEMNRCTACLKKVSRKQSAHVVTFDAEEEPASEESLTVLCKLCHAEFHSYEERDCHYRASHTEEEFIKHELTLCTEVIGRLKNMKADPKTLLFHCYLCWESFQTKVCLKVHILSHHLKVGQWKCGYCPSQSFYSTNIKRHCSKVHAELEIKCIKRLTVPSYSETEIPHDLPVARKMPSIVVYQCIVCGKHFETPVELEEHFLTLHSPSQVLVEPPPISTRPLKVSAMNYSIKIFDCRFCNRRYEKTRYLRDHLKLHHLKLPTFGKFERVRCTLNTYIETVLKNHWRFYHAGTLFPSESKKSSCCTAEYSSVSQLASHFDSSHRSSTRCKLCPFDALGTSKPEPVEWCLNLWQTDRLVEVLRKLDTESAPSSQFPCFLCDRSYKRRYPLRKHVLGYHYEIKRFKCPHCPYNNYEKTNISSHLFDKHQDIVSSGIYIDPIPWWHQNLFETDINSGLELKLTSSETDKSKSVLTHHSLGITSTSFQANKISQYETAVEQRRPPNTSSDVECNFCGFTTSLKCDLTSHIQQHHLNKVYYQCTYCPFKVFQKFAIREHNKSEHAGQPIKYVAVSSYVPCQFCKEVFFKSSMLDQHVRSAHENQLSCRLCKKKFNTVALMERHFLSYHDYEERVKHGSILCRQALYTIPLLPRDPVSRLYPCHLCNQSHKDKSALRNHILSYHLTLVPFRCGYCSFDDYEKRKIIQHCKAVHTRVPVNCVIRISVHSNILLYFSEDSKLPALFECKFCKLKFQSTKKLYEHVHTEHRVSQAGAVSISCNFENYVNALSKHHWEMEHSKYKYVWKVAECYKFHYFSASELAFHFEQVHRSHTRCACCQFDVMPETSDPVQLCLTLWQGEQVEEVAVKVRGLQRTGVSDLKCYLCEYKCAKTENLLNHVLRAHHYMNRFKCSHCHYSTATESGVTGHMNIIHKNEVDKNILVLYPIPSLVDYMDLFCQICLHKFKSKVNLIHHNSLFHAPTSCKYCTEVMSSVVELRKHTRLIHSKTPRFAKPTVTKPMVEPRSMGQRRVPTTPVQKLLPMVSAHLDESIWEASRYRGSSEDESTPNDSVENTVNEPSTTESLKIIKLMIDSEFPCDLSLTCSTSREKPDESPGITEKTLGRSAVDPLGTDGQTGEAGDEALKRPAKNQSDPTDDGPTGPLATDGGTGDQALKRPAESQSDPTEDEPTGGLASDGGTGDQTLKRPAESQSDPTEDEPSRPKRRSEGYSAEHS